MHLRSSLVFRTLFVAAILLSTVALHAQNSSSVTGTVRDASGAVLPAADVTLTNVGTGVAQRTATNADGDYLIAGLPAATYNLKITASGFKTFEATGVVLRVNEKARVDAHLEVGQVTSEINVQGAGIAQVETQSSELSGVVTGKEITQLVLNGRDFTQLVTL